MHVGCSHDIRPEVNQQIVIDQQSGSLPQARIAERSSPLAVDAATEGFWIGIRSSRSEERSVHYRSLMYVKNPPLA